MKVTERDNPTVIRVDIMFRWISVALTCPFCGEKLYHTWELSHKHPEFDPPILWCVCKKYGYAPSRRE